MIYIAICDDQPGDITLLRQHLNKYMALHPEYEVQTDSFSSGKELLLALASGKNYDLYFLDIIMPGENGISLAKTIRQNQVGGLIVFLTSSPEYSLEAFSVKAMQYLLKPLQEAEIFTVLDDTANSLKNFSAKLLLISLPEEKRKIRFSDITYVECRSRILYIHLNTGEVLKSKNIRQPFEAEMNPLLEDYRFSRPHQSYIINMNYASRLLASEIIMQDSSIIPISKKRVKDMRKEYLDFLSQQAPEL